MNEWTPTEYGLAIYGKDCEILLVPRQPYCDRGNYLAYLTACPGTSLALELDHADAWPRYYFALDRAKLECEAWLKKRGQWVEEQEAEHA